MNDATVKLVEELAAKFGTTAERLWEVLIRQALFAGICDALVTVALVVGMVWSFRLVKAKTSLEEANSWDEVAWVIWAVFVFLAALLIIASLSTTLAAFFNPEYWALKQLLP